MASQRFVIFDLDGTLFDTRADIARAVNAGLAAVGQPAADDSLIVSFVGDGVGRLVDRTLAAVGGPPEQADGVAEALLDYYRAHPADRTLPYPGIGPLLDELSGVDLALCSNKPTRLCEQILDCFGWSARFSSVLGGDWGGARKPDPAPLRSVAQALGHAAEGGIMVGDSVVDIQAGRAARMATVAVSYGFRPADELQAAAPDHLVHDVDALGERLARLLDEPTRH